MYEAFINEFSKSVDKEINKKSYRVQEKLDKHLVTFFNLMTESYDAVKKSLKDHQRHLSQN